MSIKVERRALTADASLGRGAGNVSLGLMDGRMQNHRLSKFSPYLSVLPVARPGDDLLLPIEGVAYIAFLRTPGEAAPAVDEVELTTIKVHVAGGKIFTVKTAPAQGDLSASGFYAQPADPSPFREYFFYKHGINARENTVRLGDLLVAEGIVDEATLQRGVDQKFAPLGQILIDQQRVNPEVVLAAVATQDRKRMRLGEVLIEAGLATARDIDLALAEQKQRKGMKLGEVLVSMGLVSESDLSATLAKKFNLNFVDLDIYRPNPAAANEVSRDLVQRYGFLPLDTNEQVFTVAISDPLFTELHDVLRFHFQKNKLIEEVVVTPTQLKRFVSDFLAKPDTIVVPDADERLDKILKKLALDDPKLGVQAEVVEKDTTRETDSSIIQLANEIILAAYRRGASDIHVEPNGTERATMVRFRVDGDCVSYQELPPGFRNPLVARLKIMAGLDITEKRKPQDGKIRMRLDDKHQLELRMATIPTAANNEDVVLRLLANSKPMPLDKSGMNKRNLTELQALIEKPYGLFLCVGPTGSGKTTTLHSVLGALNTVDRKIWTAEDPVEITQPGLRQVQVQPKIGVTFASAMRAFLRADPDVIMIGEMRDQETASTAVEASLTGHLVLSTLHTNTAPETITRLLDMGLDPFSFADALLGTLAQRLTRGLCPKCKAPYVAPPREREEVERALAAAGRPALPKGDLQLWRSRGCADCHETGYNGRIALHELLVADDKLKSMIQRRVPIGELRQQAIDGGMTTLLADGIDKTLAGLTDLRQVFAVCAR